MRITKYIPDCITSLNLVCGILGVVLAFMGSFDYAFYLMLAAAVFDFFDGLAARLLGAYSDFGKELDSIADMISFGVLPSIMLYSLMNYCLFGDSLLCWIPLILTVSTGIRLAKYNVSGYKELNFSGLPAPASALLCGALCCFISLYPSSSLANWAGEPIVIPALSICLALLMLSKIPMFSMKFSKDDSRSLKIKRLTFILLILASAVVCLVLNLHFSLALVLVFACYIVKNIIYALLKI